MRGLFLAVFALLIVAGDSGRYIPQLIANALSVIQPINDSEGLTPASSFNNDASNVSTPLATQTDEALRGLRLAYTLIPITGTLLAIYVMRNYEIDEEEANRIRLEISKSK